MAIGFIRNEATSDQGNVQLDSLNFANLKIRKIVIKYDSKEYPNHNGYEQDVTTDNAI